jgi:small GTP-binding protein
MSDESGAFIEAKVVIVGKSTVGKTSLVNYVTLGSAGSGVVPTVGANCVTKLIQYESQTVLIQMWDTAGHERFRAMTPLYYRGAKIAIIVFAVDDQSSFEEIEDWQNSIINTLNERIPLILVGNKVDLTRTISPEDGEKRANQMNARYLETSAMTGEGVVVLLDAIAAILVWQTGPLRAL